MHSLLTWLISAVVPWLLMELPETRGQCCRCVCETWQPASGPPKSPHCDQELYTCKQTRVASIITLLYSIVEACIVAVCSFYIIITSGAGWMRLCVYGTCVHACRIAEHDDEQRLL